MARSVADLYDRVRHLGPELVKFGIVGGIGTIVDLGGAAVLHSKYHMGPLTAKGISISAAAVVTYLGSRFWTFRHRENQPLLREGLLFVGLNVIGLLLAEAVIACTTYLLGYKDPIAYNVASLAGTGLGTIFRFYAYRKWVFLAPAATPATTVTSVPSASAELAVAMPDFAEYPPWDPMEWEPAAAPVAAHSVRPVQHPRQVRLQSQSPLIPNGAMVTPVGAASAPAWASAPAAQARSASRPAPVDSRAPGAPGRHRKQH